MHSNVSYRAGAYTESEFSSITSNPKTNVKMAKSSQDSQVVKSDTSESSSSEDEEDTKSSIKFRIEKIYSKLEDLTFQATYDKRVEMAQYRLPEAIRRPVYEVMDRPTNDLLGEIHTKMKELNKEIGGREIWKGITSYGHCYKLWGTEQSADHSNSGMYYIPIGGIEVIVSDTLEKYRAIVNITILEKS